MKEQRRQRRESNGKYFIEYFEEEENWNELSLVCVSVTLR